MDAKLYKNLIDAIDRRFLTDNLKNMAAVKNENPFNEEPRTGYCEKEMGDYFAQAMREIDLQVKSRQVKPNRPTSLLRKSPSRWRFCLWHRQ